MYFVQLDKKLWKCIGEGPRHPVTGKRRQISRRGKSKSEAKKRVEEALQQLQQSLEYNAKITFKEFAEEWLKLYRLKGNKETTVTHREYCISIVSGYIANVQMVKITAKQLQDVLNALFEEKTAYNTLRGTHNTLKQIFKHAVDTQLIPSSPAQALFIPKEKVKMVEDITQETREAYLESWELQKLLQEADAHQNVLFRTVLYTLAFTGMRPGEALALQLKDVDLKKKTISITKTLFAKNNTKDGFELTPPKTKNAIRIIDIDDIIVEKIRYLLDFKKKKDWQPSDFLFACADGIPPTVKTINQYVKQRAIKAKLEKRCRSYTLRHTHISLLAEAGVDLQYIMKRVGHLNSNITTRIYLHVTEGMKENAKSMMHKKFTELLTSPIKISDEKQK